MRKHDVRKWLHAILDLLPLLVIPIFAINIINRSPDIISVETESYQLVDFNQKIDVFSSDYWTKNTTYSVAIDNNIYSTLNYCYVANVNTISGHKYLYQIKSNYQGFRTASSNFFPYVGSLTLYNGYQNIIDGVNGLSTVILINDSANREGVSEISINLFDLSQMFGVGNEPTIQEFNNYFNNNFYEYTQSKKEILNVGTTTYNDTDIGSQFVYSLYHATDKYFNFNDVFNFGDVQNWFITNIFNGSAPISFYIVWNVILYEFIMDLIFLIYALFMFFIDFCESLIDKCFNQARGK